GRIGGAGCAGSRNEGRQGKCGAKMGKVCELFRASRVSDDPGPGPERVFLAVTRAFTRTARHTHGSPADSLAGEVLAELLQRLALDLADPLAGQPEALADLLERPRLLVVEPEPHPQDRRLPLVHLLQQLHH